jgi:hypothetical protein
MAPSTRLEHFAREVKALREHSAKDLLLVKAFQAQRLQGTYQDLLTHSQYRNPTLFFLNDLYGTKDFSQRDAELIRVIPALQRFLPDSALSTIADAVELDALSERLDHELCEVLLGSLGKSPSTCTLDQYRQAYRVVDQHNPQSREQQMKLVQHIGTALNVLVRKPLLGGLVKSMGPVAHAAGLSSMHDFLTHGFACFKAMGDAREFLAIIQTREAAIHQAMLSNLSNELLSKVIVPT